MSAFRELLEGRPLRSPLHPLLVHLPLALFPLGFLLDLASWFLTGEHAALVRGSFHCHVLGIATAVLAAGSGVIDYLEIRNDHPARRIATRHLVLNLVAVALFAASAWLRRDSPESPRTAPLPLGLTAVGLVLLSYSGYLGGRLVYDDGLAVGRHRRRGPLPERTIAAQGGADWRVVADDRALVEGRTLRVMVDGAVVTIVRVGGKLHAFQEFCTHRYGPLSEGRIDGCEVMCPWHRSRFDVRTGKVTAGPAKVDLRTFRVRSSEGKIWIEEPNS